MKFDQILVTLTRNIFNLFLALFSSILDTFTIFIRWQYNVICQFVADEHLPRANSYLVFDYLQVGKSKRCTWIYNPILKVMQMFTYFACEYTYQIIRFTTQIIDLILIRPLSICTLAHMLVLFMALQNLKLMEEFKT